MTPRIVLLLALCAAIPAWSQATGTGTDNPGTSTGTDEQPDNPLANDGMLTPPPVSGQTYPILTGSEERRNFMTLGATANVAYDDNVEGGYTGVSKGDMIYSLWPTISVNRSSTRLREVLNYSPGFTFYQPSTVFNAMDHNLTADLQYQMGTHTVLDLSDNFDRSSSLFNQPFGTSQGISGGVPTQTSGVLPPFADRLMNTAAAQLTNQTGTNGMIGLSANFSNLDYPDNRQVTGLYNATSYQGGAFVTQRLSRRQYLGANAQHGKVVSYVNGVDNVMKQDNIFGFYTIYLRALPQSTFSISITAGPEHYSIIQYPEALLSQWTPAGTVSLGWQAHHSSASASITRAVTGGGGLPGAYEEDGAEIQFRRQLRPTWDVSFSGGYTQNKSATPQFAFVVPGGHTLAAGVSASHMLTKNLKIDVGYNWMDQVYKAVVSLSPIPISNREFCAVSYHFTRPLGR
ncbi:MAG TPA: hypothetical protein VHE33_12390 [Acidobacteriaceae bacterium]|nr:hypothetical protein [Acidobacteriaceae bacterium]